MGARRIANLESLDIGDSAIRAWHDPVRRTRSSSSFILAAAPRHGQVPIRRRLRLIGAAIGEDDAAGGIDDGAAALRVEARAAVVGRRALRAVTGDEEERVRHEPAQFLGGGRERGADDRADGAVAAFPAALAAPALDEFGDFLVQLRAGGVEVLQLDRGRVGGLDEDEDPLSIPGALEERRDAVNAQVRVHRDGVRLEHVEMALRVGFGGRADVAALDVGDDQQAAVVRGADRSGQRAHAFPAERLVERRLRLDGGGVIGDGAEDAAVEFQDGVGRVGGRASGLLAEFGRERVELRIEPDDHAASFALDGFDQPVGKIFHVGFEPRFRGARPLSRFRRSGRAGTEAARAPAGGRVTWILERTSCRRPAAITTPVKTPTAKKMKYMMADFDLGCQLSGRSLKRDRVTVRHTHHDHEQQHGQDEDQFHKEPRIHASVLL